MPITRNTVCILQNVLHKYCSVPGKCPLPGKRPCTALQGATVAASIQTYGILIPGKRPCGPKTRVMFKRPWALTWDTTVYVQASPKMAVQILNSSYYKLSAYMHVRILAATHVIICVCTCIIMYIRHSLS